MLTIAASNAGFRIDLAETVTSHGWICLAPWHWDGKTLTRIEPTYNGTMHISVTQQDDRMLVQVDEGINHEEILRLVSRWLSLNWDPSDFSKLARSLDPKVESHVINGGGRFLRGSTFYEDLMKTVFTINTTWSQTQAMARNVVHLNGGTFPTPGDILGIGTKALKSYGRLGFRAETAAAITEKMLEDGAISFDGHATEAAQSYDYLLSLRGIGPYAAAHAMVLLGDFSRIPVDSEVTTYLKERGLSKADFDSWGKYQFLGYKLGRIVEKKNWIG